MAKKRKLPKKKKAKEIRAKEVSSFDKLKSFWRTRKPMLMYISAFFLFMLIFSFIGAQDFFSRISAPLLAFYTKVSGLVLNILGQGVTATGDHLGSKAYAIQVKQGCDAIAPMGLYTIATLAFPIAFKHKWKGLLIGIGSLFVLNIIRIASLWLIGRYAPEYFDFAHVELWQVLFIAITVIIWLYWLKWAMNKEKNYGQA